MIAYLAVTTVINLALGYALAIYLGHASSATAAPAVRPPRVPDAPPSARTSATSEVASPGPSQPIEDKGWAAALLKDEPAEHPSASDERAAPAASQATVDAKEIETPIAAMLARAELDAAEPAPEAVAAEARQPEPEQQVVEQELLAGIEEFRNQLAQMKGEAMPPTESGLRPAGALAN